MDRKARTRSRRRRRNPLDKGVPRDLYLSLHCEFNGDILARAVIVKWDKQVELDISVKGQHVGGTHRKKRLAVAHNSTSCGLLELSSKIQSLTQNKVLIGYDLERSLQALDLKIPWIRLRDCATYSPFMRESRDSVRITRTLLELGEEFECSSASSLPKSLAQRAICCMELYRLHRDKWEQDMRRVEQKIEQDRQQRLLSIIPETLQTTNSSTEDPSPGDEAVLIQDEGMTSRKLPSDIQPDEAYEAYQRVRSQSVDTQGSKSVEKSFGLLPRPRGNSVGDDSRSSGALSNSIWMVSAGDSTSSLGPRDEAWSNSMPSQGVQNPRPMMESMHPVDTGDWLAEPFRSKEDDLGLTGSNHLPSKLLSDSDESSVGIAPREYSSHIVDGASEDWLDQGEPRYPSPRKNSWFRRRPSTERSQGGFARRPSMERTSTFPDDTKLSNKFPFFRK